MIRATVKKRTSERWQVLLLLGWQTPMLLDGIVRYAGEVGWALDLHYVRVGRPPMDWKGDGIISLITHPKDYEALQHFLPSPMVDLSMAWVYHLPLAMRKSGRNIPRVLFDEQAIGRLGAEYLLERGFKNLALLNWGNFWFESERLTSFRRAVEAGGARFHEIAYHKHFHYLKPEPGESLSGADRWLADEIRALPKPLGIFTGTDDVARHVFNACAAAGVLVPEEVAVLGCNDDSLICDFSSIPLSSVVSGWDTVGYEAARLLGRLMDGKPAPKSPILIAPTGVVTRMSTNVMAVPDPKVARALRYIWEHYQMPIQILDVARVAGLPRRSLERAFGKFLARTVAYEIAHCRIEHAKRLLLETGLKAHEIAEQSGFSSIVNFSQVFLRVEGVRPSHFRRQHAHARTRRTGVHQR